MGEKSDRLYGDLVEMEGRRLEGSIEPSQDEMFRLNALHIEVQIAQLAEAERLRETIADGAGRVSRQLLELAAIVRHGM